MNDTTPLQTAEELQDTLDQAIKVYELSKMAKFGAKADKKRSEPLLSSIQATEEAARDLLEKVGLARIVCAPLQLYETVDPTRRSDEAIAKAFADAQLAQADLRVCLFRLAKALATEGDLEGAERSIRPLLDEPKTSFHANAKEILCELHYLAATTLLDSGQLILATNAFEKVINFSLYYQDTLDKVKVLSIQLLRDGKWREAAHLFLLMGDEVLIDPDIKRRLDHNQKLQAAMRAHIDREGKQRSSSIYANSNQLLGELYYQSAISQIKAGHLDGAFRNFKKLATLNPKYKNSSQHVIALFNQTVTKKSWMTAANIFLLLEDMERISTQRRALLDNNPDLQEAIWSISEIKLLWKTKVDVYGSHYYQPSGPLTCDLFIELHSNLIIFGFESYFAQYANTGVMILDLKSGGILEKTLLTTNLTSRQEVNSIKTIEFNRAARKLLVTRTRGKPKVINISESIKIITPPTKTNPLQNDQNRIGNSTLLFEKIKQKTGEANIGGFAISSNGLYMVATSSKTYDRDMAVYLFRKTALPQ